ncbi:MAG: Flp pilus assembly protein CpaB [Xanthobacteraceae bacterium]
MRSSTIVMIIFAVLFGVIAVVLAQAWLNSQAEMRAKSLQSQKKPMPTQTVVVASKPLRFGAELGAMSLREIAWPESAVPAGSFSTIAEITATGRRVVLTSIEANEPILSSKITGAGQRATLSALLQDGMKAVTIRVNDVEGVAGFVLPGDRVDVMLTRQQDKATAAADVVLQNVRVLAVDQLADERSEKPSVAKAVTLEVEVLAAQKLALAATVGALSLALRKAGEATAAATRRVTLTDLPNTAVIQDRFATISVVRGGQRSEYSVPTEDEGHSLAAAGAR